MPDSIERIRTQQRVSAVCAVDTVPLLAQRITNLLAWGRRMTVVKRWLGSDTNTELLVGLTVDRPQLGDKAVVLTTRPDSASFVVYLAPGISTFGFSAYASDGNATEAEVRKRYQAEDDRRRELTHVVLQGGGEGQSGPGNEDQITITYWNSEGVGRQTLIGFDTHAYYDAWTARENQGWAAAGESLDATYCKELAWVAGPYRVRCGFQIVEGVCTGAADHVTLTSAPNPGGEGR